jgi:hypothetical protein
MAANKILLKKSSVAAKVPLITDLEYGEVALNYTDGKLYFKNASNVIKSFSVDSFASDITVNGLTVGKGRNNVASNTALGVDALGSTVLTPSNINNVGIGDNTLNDITTNPSDLGVSFSGSGYSPTNTTQTITLQYLSGTPIKAGGTYPTVTVYIDAIGQIDTGSIGTVNFGSGFTDTSTVMTFTGLGGSGARFTYSALNIAKNNTVVGYNAGSATTTGENNTAIGYNAGSLTINGKNNTYIGSGVVGSAAYRENEIIIGANATGGGSNTTTIGNVDTQTTTIMGNVSINNSLQVSGSVNLANGPFNFVDIGTGTMSGYTHNYSTGNASSPSAINIGTGVSTGAIRTITVGATLGPSTIVIGPTNDTNIINIGNGATQSGLTKTINIGSNSVTGSTTTLNIGSTSGTSTTTLRGAVTLSATTQAINIGTTQSTGAITIGGTTASGAGTITIGQSTAAQTVNIATGANTATKIVNIGTGGTTSNSTNINIGSSGPVGGLIVLGQSSGGQGIVVGGGATASGLTKQLDIGTGGLSGSTTSIFIGTNTVGATSTTTVYGTLNATGNLTVTGDLTIGGTTTTVNATNLEISDPLIYLAKDNTANINDIGFIGKFNPGTTQYTGLVRDASDSGIWKLFAGVTAAPTTTVDFTAATYGKLQVGDLNIGNLTASTAVFTDANKNLISKTTTGNGNVVLSSTPTLSYVSVNNEFTVKATTNSGSTFYTAKIFSGDTDPYDGNRLVNILTDTGNSYHGGTNEINLGSKNRGTNIYLSASMLDIDSYQTVIYGGFTIGQGDRGQQITIGEVNGDGSQCPPLLIEAYTTIGSSVGSSATLTVNAPATFNASSTFNGQVTIGGTGSSQTLTFGRSTSNQTVNIATGVTAAGITKAINIGTAGDATSTTNINIGSATGTSTTTHNGINKYPTLTASQAVFTDANKNLVSVATTGSGNVVLSTNPAITGGATLSTTTQAISIGNGQTTGTITLGDASGTGKITIGQSSSSLQQITIGTSSTKIGIGSNGLGLYDYTAIIIDPGYNGSSGIDIGTRGTGFISIGNQPDEAYNGSVTRIFGTLQTYGGTVTFNDNVSVESQSFTCRTLSATQSASITGSLSVNGGASITGNLNVGGTITGSISYSNLTNKPIAANEPYTTLTYASTVTPTTNTNVRITCTGNLTVNAPAAAADGAMVRMWVVASDADRTVSLQNTIKIPRNSSFTSPQTIVSGDKARVTIQYDLTRAVWELVTFVNGY